MLASKYIEELQKRIDEHGDLEVVKFDPDLPNKESIPRVDLDDDCRTKVIYV